MIENNAIEALALYLERRPDAIENAQRILFLNARVHSFLRGLKDRLLVEQPQKRFSEELSKAGYNSEPAQTLPDIVLVYLSGQKEESLAAMAQAFALLTEGGLCICCADNDLGASRYEKHLKQLAGEIDTFSKYHSRVFSAVKSPAINQSLLGEWSALIEPKLNQDDFYTVPGIFSFDAIDEASKLLIESMPTEPSGIGADLGAGWGYLSYELLKRYQRIGKVSLIDSDSRALKMAKLNIDRLPNAGLAEYLWLDVTAGLSLRNLDWVVMNPPFHIGKATRPELGMKFLEQAALILRPGGSLYLVANVTLAYEAPLRASFSEFREVLRRDGFKVICATK